MQVIFFFHHGDIEYHEPFDNVHHMIRKANGDVIIVHDAFSGECIKTEISADSYEWMSCFNDI